MYTGSHPWFTSGFALKWGKAQITTLEKVKQKFPHLLFETHIYNDICWLSLHMCLAKKCGKQSQR